MKKNDIIIIVLSIIIVILVGFIICDKLLLNNDNNGDVNTNVSDSNDTNTTGINNSINSTNQNSVNNDASENVDSSVEANINDLNSYIGEWYQDSTSVNDNNPTYLNINNVYDNVMVANLYINGIANFVNFSMIINESVGTFEAYAENGISSDDDTAKISGAVILLDDSIQFIISQSNVLYIESESYSFNYKK